jgi:hypothetical protein
MVVFSKHQKRRAVGLLLLGGGAIVVGGRLLQLQIRTYQKEQNALCEMYLTKAASKQPISRKPKVAVNARFAGRLGEILQICVPSVFSKEALFILVQSCLLVNRTLLTGFDSSLSEQHSLHLRIPAIRFPLVCEEICRQI